VLERRGTCPANSARAVGARSVTPRYCQHSERKPVGRISALDTQAMTRMGTHVLLDLVEPLQSSAWPILIVGY
jgi:hypothetical protein